MGFPFPPPAEMGGLWVAGLLLGKEPAWLRAEATTVRRRRPCWLRPSWVPPTTHLVLCEHPVWGPPSLKHQAHSLCVACFPLYVCRKVSRW